MAEATLSSKNQIVVPREAREALGVHAGDKLLVVVRGKSVVILPRPASWSKAIRGLGREKFPEGYLDAERAALCGGRSSHSNTFPARSA
jgi:AbrB family looped-hinge helix DNA binding protein